MFIASQILLERVFRKVMPIPPILKSLPVANSILYDSRFKLSVCFKNIKRRSQTEKKYNNEKNIVDVSGNGKRYKSK